MNCFIDKVFDADKHTLLTAIFNKDKLMERIKTKRKKISLVLEKINCNHFIHPAIKQFNHKAIHHPKSISVLSPIFSDLVSPLMPVSLPIRESSSTTSYSLEKEPMIDSFTIV